MRTVAVVGTGLIGGSLALALRRAGVRVQGYDADAERLARAVDRGVIDEAADVAGSTPTPAPTWPSWPSPSRRWPMPSPPPSMPGSGAVSDVGSVKAPVVRAVEARAGRAASRFVGGHPMAGSAGEEGIEGADADLFAGAAWVLTPTATTDPAAFTAVRDLVAVTGAKVMAIEPELHDELVAIVSHLPHLAASAVMHLATDASPTTRPCCASPPAASGP